VARIEVRRLSKTYPAHPGGGAQRVIDGLDLAIEDHEFVCLLGPSGCGKSTFLNLVAGLDGDYEGSIALDGRELNRRAARVGYVFQEPRLLPWLDSEDNIRFALRNCKVPRSEWTSIIDENLAMTGLAAFRRHYPHQLSGGMRQRLALARALSVSPQVLLMDEPFSGLDELTARRLRMDLLEIWRRKHKTVVFVTHNAYEASFLADRVVVMAGGRVRGDYRVNVPRPRDYDDPRVFEVNRDVVKAFLAAAGEH
jgi:ABC-type nitrate/sulfonate/bicarbonate transport system ATPase subunit